MHVTVIYDALTHANYVASKHVHPTGLQSLQELFTLEPLEDLTLTWP